MSVFLKIIYYTVAVSCLLVAAGTFLMPAFRHPEPQKRNLSLSQMRQIVMGMVLYAGEDGDSHHFPYNPRGYEYAMYKLLEYDYFPDSVFTSPLSRQGSCVNKERKCIENCSYVYLNRKSMKFKEKEALCVIAEKRYRDEIEGGNLAFLDGSARFVRDPDYRPEKYLGKTYEEIFGESPD